MPYCWRLGIKLTILNYNVVATWPRHVISLVIIPNNILLSPPIAYTYCLVPDGSPFRYTKPHSSIVGNWLSYIALLESPPAAIPFVEKRTSRYSSVILLQFWFLLTNIPFCWDSTFLHPDLLGFGSPHKVLRLMKTYRTELA